MAPDENPLPPIDTSATDAADRPVTHWPTKVNELTQLRKDVEGARDKGLIDTSAANRALDALDVALGLIAKFA